MEISTRRAILVVDDEPLVAQVLSAMLKILGFTALLANSGMQGVELLRANRGAVAAALLDVRMPIMDGPTTMDALHVLDPELPCVFISGETGPYTWATYSHGAGCWCSKSRSEWTNFGK